MSSRVVDLEGSEVMDMQVIKDLLADDLYDSKDWRDADTAERVEYLIELVAYKNREIDLWLEQIEHLKSSIMKESE